MDPTSPQGAKHKSQNTWKCGTGHVYQAGVRPDTIVFVHPIEFIEPHHADWATYPFLSLAGDLWDAVRSVELKASGQHFFAVSTAAATKFKNAGSWREKLKKRIQVPACAARSAGRVDRRLIGVEAKRRLIACCVIGQ